MTKAEVCSKCCIALSIPAVIFLVIVGYLLDKQSFYISVELDDPDSASTDCYFAAMLYVLSIVVSLGAIWYHKRGRSLLVTTQEELLHGDEGAELLGGADSGYGSLTHLSQMPLMPQGYSRSDQYS